MFDPTKPVQTRGGQEVRILATDAKPPYSIVYETTDGAPVLQRVNREGHLITKFTRSNFDLVNKPEELAERTFYVNVGDSFSAAHYAKRGATGRSEDWPVIKVTAKVGPNGLEDIREIVSAEAA